MHIRPHPSQHAEGGAWRQQPGTAVAAVQRRQPGGCVGRRRRIFTFVCILRCMTKAQNSMSPRGCCA